MNKQNVLRLFRDDKGRTGPKDEYEDHELLEAAMIGPEVEDAQQITLDDIYEMLDEAELTDDELLEKYPENNKKASSEFPRILHTDDDEAA